MGEPVMGQANEQRGGRTIPPPSFHHRHPFPLPSPACDCRDSFALARGMFLTSVTERAGKKLRMFEVANVKLTYRLRVPELTRQEVHSQLAHYATTGRFMMLNDLSMVDAFAVEYYRTLASGVPREVFLNALFHARRVETAPKRVKALLDRGLEV